MINIRLIKRKDEWFKVYLDDKGCELFDKYNWFSNGYIQRNQWNKELKKNKVIRFHREIMNFPKQSIDHIDGNPLNNQLSNLRLCTHKENMQNVKKSKVNKSGYKGVSKCWYSLNRWRATINIDGKQKHIGYFNSPELAARAYDKVALSLYMEFAKLNFPE